MAGGSSLSLRGRSIAIPNDRERNADPARLLRLCFAKRPKGRSIFAAPFGASCEKCPPIRPYMVVAPKGAARRRLGLRNRLANGSAFRFPAPKSECDARPNLGAECPLLLGAARLVGVCGCFAFPNDGSAAFPLAALVRALRFPNDCPWDSQPHPRRVGCPSFAFDCAFSSPRRGRSLFKVCSSAVDVCFALLNGHSAKRGRHGRRSRPKPSAALFRLSKLAEKLPRSVFRLRRASPPPQ